MEKRKTQAENECKERSCQDRSWGREEEEREEFKGYGRQKEVSRLRMGKGPPDQGAKSGPAQAPPAASARHFHDGPMQAQERRSSELRIIRQT